MSGNWNIFACLVHESFECVVDLLQNLRYFDPCSPVLLYNGGRDRRLLDSHFPFEHYNATVVPDPKPVRWGRLHDFAFDCLRFAIDNYAFETLTIVDSDQLCIRSNYSQFVRRSLRRHPGVGLFGSPGARFGPQTADVAARTVYSEIELWEPLLEQLGAEREDFVRWSFWPATIFTYPAAKDICRVLGYAPQLQAVLNETRVHATEEVIFPTLVGLLGYEIAENPCSYQFIGYRVLHTPDSLDVALRTPNAYWIHPVTRRYDDPLRERLREAFNHYASVSGVDEVIRISQESPMLRTLPILDRMRGIEGWLNDDEADLLIAATAKAVSCAARDGAPFIVEVGSYCGRSTVVLGLTLKGLGLHGARVYAIDPHDGKVGAQDQGLLQRPATFEKFMRNIHEAGVTDIIEPIKARSFEVTWRKPIALLFIDGLHDYPNVARDFYHFAGWMQPGGFVAFHDYADYFPGVKRFVDELIDAGEYQLVDRVQSLVVLKKK